MQHLEISRAWGGPPPTLLVTDFQWLGTADVVGGTPWEEQNQSRGASLSGRGVLSRNSPPCPLRRCTYHFTRIFCSARSGFLSLVFAPSLVACCLVWSPLHPLLRGFTLQPQARGSVALRLCKTLRKLLLCHTWFPASGVLLVPPRGQWWRWAVCWIFFFF